MTTHNTQQWSTESPAQHSTAHAYTVRIVDLTLGRDSLAGGVCGAAAAGSTWLSWMGVGAGSVSLTAARAFFLSSYTSTNLFPSARESSQPYEGEWGGMGRGRE